ncbi:hypothetical protein AB0368_07060 [Actinoplanes sp. NPDC051475]
MGTTGCWHTVSRRSTDGYCGQNNEAFAAAEEFLVRDTCASAEPRLGSP